MKRRRGFIALISVLILSSVLLAAVVSMSARSLSARANALHDDAAASAQEAVRGCADAVRLMLAADASYAGGTILTIGEDTCVVGPVTHTGDSVAFTANVAEGNVSVDLRVTIDDENFSLHAVPISNAPP